jgi:hypothetical protein
MVQENNLPSTLSQEMLTVQPTCCWPTMARERLGAGWEKGLGGLRFVVQVRGSELRSPPPPCQKPRMITTCNPSTQEAKAGDPQALLDYLKMGSTGFSEILPFPKTQCRRTGENTQYHTHMHTCVHTRTHGTYLHIERTYTYACTCTHRENTHMHAHAYTHTQNTHMHREHTCMHIHTHTEREHTCTCMHTCTHTHRLHVHKDDT